MRPRTAGAWAADAIVLAVLRLLAPLVPVHAGGVNSLGQARAVCTSALGPWVHGCGYVNAAYGLLTVLAVASAACMLVAVALVVRR